MNSIQRIENILMKNFSNVTVDVESQDEAWQQSAMYNTDGKYGGVKAALGNEWIRGIIRKEAGENSGTEEMAIAMKEIFNDMIPDKMFNGPRPTPEGRLEFNVITGGNEHDIDDLSSGEKEILFGYLKTRVRAPKNSVIIVDEPELHLNPRMIAGLPNLYERHIGRALQNQVWLVTHSDVFLRRAFDSGRIQVFHMDMPQDQDDRFNQMKRVGTEERYERACLELIGNFAMYEPQGKTILVEGGSKFDEEVVERLFMEELRGVNIASVAGKNEVRMKKKELWNLQDIQGIRKEVVTITDGDGVPEDRRIKDEKGGDFRWDLYDIESYLLNEEYICEAVKQLTLRQFQQIPVERVNQVIKTCAREVRQELINSRLVGYVRNKLASEINQNVNRLEHRSNVTDEDLTRLLNTSNDAANAINAVVQEMTINELRELLKSLTEEVDSKAIWETEDWKRVLPGKRVLQKVAETLVGEGTYRHLRNVIIGLMATDAYKPQGMKETIQKALTFRRELTGR